MYDDLFAVASPPLTIPPAPHLRTSFRPVEGSPSQIQASIGLKTCEV